MGNSQITNEILRQPKALNISQLKYNAKRTSEFSLLVIFFS